jgi:hypothetical protein
MHQAYTLLYYESKNEKEVKNVRRTRHRSKCGTGMGLGKNQAIQRLFQLRI